MSLNEVRTFMLSILSVMIIVSLGATAAAQPISREEIFSLLTKDGPAKGDAKAPVILIEFSDFRCSFCRKFWQTTLPSLEREYIKKGKVRFIYRHFAVLGKPSELAAQAAECAGEQGRFWEYHDKLFVGAGSPVSFMDGKLKGYAKELQLKREAFNMCLDAGKHLTKVQGETALAFFLGARGTPTFLLNRQMLVGAQPIEVFESLIEEVLKKLTSLEKTKR